MGTRVNRGELLAALGRVMPGISKRGTVEQSSCFVFRDGWIFSFNDEICCRTVSKLDPELEVAVRAEPLVKWLELVVDDDVDVSIDRGQFKLRAGRDKCWVRAEQDITLPIDEVDTPTEWHTLPPDFWEAVERVMGTAGGANDEFMTRCVHVHPDYVEACDRKQATRYELETGATAPFLVQAVTIAQGLNMDLTRFGETADWVHFRNKGLIFSCRRHLDSYPTDGITKMLQFRGAKCTLPKGAEVAAKLGEVFTGDDKDNNRLDVDLTPGKMTVRGEGDKGGASRELDTTYTGPPVSFRLSPQLLIQLVKFANECEVGPGRLLITGDHWKYLTVLGKPVSQEDNDKKAVAVGAEESDEEDDD